MAKKLEDMNLYEYVRIKIDRRRCNSCSNCYCHQQHWVGYTSCGSVHEKADEIAKRKGFYDDAKMFLDWFKKAFEEYESDTDTESLSDMLLGLLDIDSSKPQPVVQEDMLGYDQTINYMKSKGYKHCYMCGASFDRKDEHR